MRFLVCNFSFCRSRHEVEVSWCGVDVDNVRRGASTGSMPKKNLLIRKKILLIENDEAEWSDTKCCLQLFKRIAETISLKETYEAVRKFKHGIIPVSLVLYVVMVVTAFVSGHWRHSLGLTALHMHLALRSGPHGKANICRIARLRSVCHCGPCFRGCLADARIHVLDLQLLPGTRLVNQSMRFIAPLSFRHSSAAFFLAELGQESTGSQSSFSKRQDC